MSTETDKYESQAERDARHSALEEFSRDERRPAVILLSALVLAAIFFAFGIMVGRWTADQGRSPAIAQEDGARPQAPTPSNAVTPQQPASAASATPPPPPVDKQRRYALLIEDLKSSEAARSLAQSMERAGYKDVRTPQRTPAAAAANSFQVLIGRYTRDEAEAEATRLRARGGPRLKNVRVVEDPGG
ncbi:MAG TPA: hypothetical protein VE842_14145 [Pyrinomonadaceae bacterium]|jgi:hypothetical protein|nr:hypothetical protein [Pyrinomonadaceae bacterium]